MAGACGLEDCTIPNTCQGSIEPCTNTTFVTCRFNAPYKTFVRMAADSNKFISYLQKSFVHQYSNIVGI